MEFSLFGGALALSRYVPAANVARATRSVLSLVSSERVEVGGAQQARKGMIQSNEVMNEAAVVRCDVPLANMFGYSTELRSATQGKGEFTMEYKLHAPVPRDKQEGLIKEYLERTQKKAKGEA